MLQNGHYNEDKKYVQQHIIPCYAADVDFSLKPAAFMDYAQEIAYLAANEMGFGYEALQERNTAWVLSRFTIVFDEYPKWRDEVEFYSWHKGLEGLFFLRDFEMKSPEGKMLIKASSSWLVINTETRRLVRSDEVNKMFTETSQCHDNALDASAPKVVMPKDAEVEHVKDHQVVYSDCDFIGHANNVHYVVWCMDCIPNEVTFNKHVKKININFNKECKQGETVSISRACVQNEDGTTSFFFEGLVEGKQSFIAEIIF